MAAPEYGRIAVVGGTGGVGRLFAGHLAGHCRELVIIDPAGPAYPDGAFKSAHGPEARFEYHCADVTAPDPRAERLLAGAELVLLAVPEDVALAAAGPLSRLLRPGCLLADTLSVKGPWLDAVAARATDFEVLSLNPMFAPGLGFAGRPVAAVPALEGPRSRALMRLLELWGGRVVRLADAEEHDRLTAACQVLVHAAVLAFGSALSELETSAAKLLPLAPPPFTTLLALLARISANTPEAYWDIQRANPSAPAARHALAAAVRRLAQVVECGDRAAFDDLLHACAAVLGPDLDPLAERCARMFTAAA